MADEMENMANDVAADEDQISEDDWAAAMAEQAVTEPTSGQAAQPADIFPSFGGNAGSAKTVINPAIGPKSRLGTGAERKNQ